MSHLAHWHGEVAELDFSRIEFAISLGKLQAQSAQWRRQTLLTALSANFESEYFLVFHKLIIQI